MGSLGFISQDIPTIVGPEYLIDFFVIGTGGTPNEFLVQFGGATLFDAELPDTGVWTEMSFLVPAATGPTTTLTFGFRDDPFWIALDDVSVAAVPEPSSLALRCRTTRSP